MCVQSPKNANIHNAIKLRDKDGLVVENLGGRLTYCITTLRPRRPARLVGVAGTQLRRR
ncbi:MAG: hypothetical protein Q7J10_07915 [Methanosarcinaceae archaeon]|nr:hypothetical protein [Methanosarcinaceae archaeon]